MLTLTCLRCKSPNTDGRQRCHQCDTPLPLLHQGVNIFFYQVGKQVGQSPMSLTFLAQDRYRSEPCIIREIIAPTDAPDLLQRMTKASIRLKKVTSVHLADFMVLSKGRHCFVVEYVHGRTLADDLDAHHQRPDGELLAVLDQLLDSLDELHAESIFHGDITPEHVLRREEDGTFQLLNFASIRDVLYLTADDPASNAAAASIYIPPYAPQERLRGELCAASDIYSVGLTALCLLTGQTPEEVYTRYYRPQSETWELSQAPVEEPLRRVLDRMLRRSPTDRFETIAEVKAALLRFRAPKLCANPGCRTRLLDGETHCPNCGTEFEQSWIERWLKETVRPAFDRDVVEALREKTDLFDFMKAVGLPPDKLEAAWAKEVKCSVGVTERELEAWITEHVQPAIENGGGGNKRVINRTEQEALIQWARFLGLGVDEAQRILERECERRDMTIERNVLYCPAARCSCSFAHKDRDHCPRSGVPLSEPSYGLWLDKLVRPGLDDNLWAGLQSREQWLSRAGDMGLSEIDAGQLFAREVKRIAGAGEEELRTWFRTTVEPARQAAVVTDETRSAMIGKAEQAGIDYFVAQQIIDQFFPALVLEPDRLDFDRLKPGATPSVMITVRNVGAGQLSGQVEANVSWLTVTPSQLKAQKREQKMRVEVDTSGLPVGFEDSGEVTFRTAAGVRTIPVHLKISEARREPVMKAPSLISPRQDATSESPPSIWAATRVSQGSRKGMSAVGAVLVVVIGVVSAIYLQGGDEENHPPVVAGLDASAAAVRPGQDVLFTADVRDPDGDHLSYTWHASAGNIVGQGSTVTLSTLSVEPGTSPLAVKVNLTVTDGRGGTVSGEKEILVAPPPKPKSSTHAAAPLAPPPPRQNAPPGAPREELALEHLKRAEELFVNRHYAAALRQCDQGLKFDPNNKALREKKAAIESVQEILGQQGS